MMGAKPHLQEAGVNRPRSDLSAPPAMGGSVAAPLLDDLSTAVLCFDRSLELRYLNSAAEDLLLVSRRSGNGRRLEDLIPNGGCLADNLRRSLRERQGYLAFGLRLGIKQGGSLLELDARVTPLSGEPPSGILLELSASPLNPLHGQESRRPGLSGPGYELIPAVAHEVKNPLGAILGAAQLLEDETLGKSGRECLRIILRETERLRGVVERMLRGSDSLHWEAVNVHEVLEYVCELVGLEKAEGPHIVREYDPSLPEFRADRDCLVQAFLNVLRNALSAVPTGPQGRVRLRTAPLRRRLLAGYRHRWVARVDIIDNGPGLPPAPEDPAAPAHWAAGSGLGLPIARSMLRAHGGELLYERRGAETVFSLLIPMQGLQDKPVEQDLLPGTGTHG